MSKPVFKCPKCGENTRLIDNMSVFSEDVLKEWAKISINFLSNKMRETVREEIVIEWLRQAKKFNEKFLYWYCETDDIYYQTDRTELKLKKSFPSTIHCCR